MFRSILHNGPFAACLVGSVCLFGCASTPPKELVDARAAYQRASEGPAARYSPAQLHTAEQSLKLAEQTFEDEGDADVTRDRAYVATRKAELAATRGRIERDRAQFANDKKRAQQMQATQLARAQQQLADEAAKRKAAEEELARLASVKQDLRGTVITLSGSVLFQSDKAELLPDAEQRLSDVARALNNGRPDAQIVVEGHTDAKGSKSYNLELSARRAEAVRTYLISQGVDSNRIRAEGLGFSQPVSDNKSAEGRANNRRVEIVVQPTGT